MSDIKKADDYKELPSYNDSITNDDLKIYDTIRFAGENWTASDDVKSEGYYNQEENEAKSVPNAKNHNWIFRMFYDNLAYFKKVICDDGGIIDQLANKIASKNKIGQVKIGAGLDITKDGTLNVYDIKNGDTYLYNLPVGAMMFLPWGEGIPSEYIAFNKDNQIIKYSDYKILIDTITTKNSELIGVYSQANKNDNCLFYYNGTTKPSSYSNDDTFVVKNLEGCFVRNVKTNNTIGKVTPDQLRSHKHNSITMGLSSNLNGGDGSYVVGSPNSNISSKKISGTIEIGGTNIYNEDSKTYENDNELHGENAPKNIQLVLVMKAKKSSYTFTSKSYDVDPNPVGTVINVLVDPAVLSEKLNTEYKGYAIADGSVKLKSEYNELYTVLPKGNYTTGKHGYTWSCNASGTYDEEGLYFVLPNLLDTYARYNSTNTGSYQSSALPNIKGKGPLWYSNSKWYEAGLKNGHTTGPFYIEAQVDSTDKYGIQDAVNSNNDFRMWFDANRANSIYQNINEVRPNSINTMPLIKIISNKEFTLSANISL